jgi:hypothetical protein
MLVRWLKLYVLPFLMLVAVGIFIGLKMWAVAAIFAASVISWFLPQSAEYPFFGRHPPGWLKRIHREAGGRRGLAVSAAMYGAVFLIAILAFGVTIGVVIGAAVAAVLLTLSLLRSR